MSVSSPAKCVFTKHGSLLRLSRRDLRPFHNTTPVCMRRRPRYASIKADDMNLMEKIVNQTVDARSLDPKTVQRLQQHMGKTYYDLTPQQLEEVNRYVENNSAKFSKKEQQILPLKYNPAQLESIKAAEKTIDQRDLRIQKSERTDANRIRYKDDDFTEVDYVYDKPERDFTTGWLLKPGQDITMKNDAELSAKLAEFIIATGKKYTDNGMFNPHEESEELLEQLGIDWEKFMHDPRTLFNAPNEETYKLLEDRKRDTVAAELPKLDDPITRASTTAATTEAIDPHMQRISLRMGWSIEEISKVRTKALVRRRVVNQTRMGKVASQSILTIAGNGNGLLGIGMGKSTEPEEASRQAMLRAIRNMKPIPRYEDRTIYGEVKAKVGATEVTLTAKHPGFGNRAMHLIFEMTRAAGISDLHARVPRSRNPMNVCKATLEALMKQRLPEDIARGRGRKLVDVRKVYYGGRTL